MVVKNLFMLLNKGNLAFGEVSDTIKSDVKRPTFIALQIKIPDDITISVNRFLSIFTVFNS
jgi:hypothetical protein